MNEYSDDFKGVWFPRNLWLDKSISLVEKGILVVINNLDSSDEHCWATNNYLADFFQCSISTVKRAIAHLKELKYIEETEGGKVGVCRRLKVIINIDNYPAQNEPSSKGTQLKMNPVQNELGGGSIGPGYPAQNDPLIIYNNNINNNIRKNKKNSSAKASPTSDVIVETKLDKSEKKKQRETKKQQRYNEVISSTEFNTILHDGLSEKDFTEIDTLWSEFVELRCSKDYKAFTDGAVKRNLNILKGTTAPERKTILEKSVVKGWTGLFPLNNFDKQRIEAENSSIEGSDEWLYKKIFDTKCKEKEDELPEGTTHTLLMDLVQKYGDAKVKEIYYNKVKPQIENIYGIKRDWSK